MMFYAMVFFFNGTELHGYFFLQQTAHNEIYSEKSED